MYIGMYNKYTLIGHLGSGLGGIRALFPQQARRGHEGRHRRANTAHIRQSQPDSGFGLQVKVLKTLKGVCPLLDSGGTHVKRFRGALVFKAHKR